MSRCDYDGVFYRVFCVTLLATAFTFTVILTNVFIDIDGLLAKKGKQSHDGTDNDEYKENVKSSSATYRADDTTTENIFDKNYIDDQSEPLYRTKRSIGSPNIVSNYHKNKINALASQLTTLLARVDENEGRVTREVNRKEERIDLDLTKIPLEDYFTNYESTRKNTPEKELHLAIHKIPQDNVIDNFDANDISTAISKLLKNYNTKGYKSVHAKDPEVVMKTIIEIKPLDNVLKRETSNSQGNMKIPSKITYKHLKNIERENLSNDEHKSILKLRILGPNSSNKKIQHSHRVYEIIPKHDQYYYLNKALEYLRIYLTSNKEQFAYVSLDKRNKDRMKRQVKVRYEDYDATTPKIKPVRKGSRKADDELYVEIETHFDGSGARGERKKKLVKSLIDRIQKAIRSDDSSKSDKKKTREHLQIKKRTQNPLKHKPKNVMKTSSVEHRQQNPINKVELMKDIVQDGGQSVDDLDEPLSNPTSFSLPNIENSAEVGNSEFNNILSSGIPQRIQVPLNLRHPGVSGKPTNSYGDAGNVTLFIKDIDGSGFSVGFNQYVDEPPDVDSMKLFSGLENLIKSYHEDYDQNNNENNNVNEIEESADQRHELVKRDVNGDKNHIVYRRSVEQVQNDYRSDAYNIIFDKKILPFAKYEDILNRPSRKTIPSDYEYKIRNYDYNPKNIKIFTKDIKIKALPIVLNEEIFDKKMRPSEIFSLANQLLQGGKNRDKRSMNVQKITNLKSRIKLARYINTKKMESKALFFKNKRNKRNVDKIRIFASDQTQPNRQSEENVYVLSGENFFTNRASLREIELPESDTGDEVGGEQHGDDTVPFVFDEPYPNSPNKEPNYITNIFDNKYGQNGLMAKYPHIFPGAARDSKEAQFANDNDLLFKRGNKQQLKLENLLGMRAGDNASPEKDGRIPDIVNAIMPNKNNYKVTVKILPKNLTNAPSGFKEMHTVINKTYNNNGVQYYSLVNVSEISKIEKINKTKENEHTDDNGNNKQAEDAKMQEQEKNMKLLLALQKEKIEQQLLHLNKEKEGLETILRDRDGIKERNIHDLFKDFMHLQPNKPNDDMDFLHDMSHLHVHNTATVEPVTEPNVILPITNHDIRIKLEPPKEPEFNKIEPVKDSEHVTNEILSQINKNTDILQCFLKKLSDKFDQTPVQATRSPVERVTEDNHLRSHPDLKDWGLHHLHDSFFNEHMPKNESHYSIPFVYAYQHPYLPQNKPPLPMAKIVYHGHIHANNLHKYAIDGRKYNANTSNSKHNHPTTNPLGISHEGNKFFIDSLARDVIVTQPKIVQKEYPASVVNVTQIH